MVKYYGGEHMHIEMISLIQYWEADTSQLPLHMTNRVSNGLGIGIPDPERHRATDIVYPDGTLRADADAVFFHRKGDSYTRIVDGTHTKCLVINFHGDDLPEHFVVRRCGDLREKFEEICRLWMRRREDEYYHLDCIAKTSALLAEVLRRRDSLGTPLRHRQRIAPALDYIHSHYTDAELRISDIAEAAGIGERYLCRAFTDTIGKSPKRYITDLRIRYARELLTGGLYAEHRIMSVEDIAYAAGFSEANYFSTVFRHETGMTPGEFRKMTERSCRT